ncbi:MAG: hypothetical protein CL417_01290 [Acidimicrobiaceae bacterium]|nr:hypothetical protein [Acidimicrobiaceae bacterium]|tara:strand:- start:11648 stop:11917 length:270 start_codon:yes stop_codon:yes gene_type:complete
MTLTLSIPEKNHLADLDNKSSRLRYLSLCAIAKSDDGLTADEIADVLDEPILEVRPRVSELVRSGAIFNNKIGRSQSGNRAKCWKVVDG